MSSIKKEYIFMPTNDKQFERVVVSEYLTRGIQVVWVTLNAFMWVGTSFRA